jgi:hypothetical protein
MKMRKVLNFVKGAFGLAALVAFVLALVGLFSPLSQRVPVGQQAYPILTVTPTALPLPVTPTLEPYPPPQIPTVVPPAMPTTVPAPPSPTLVGPPTPVPPTPTPPGYTPGYTGTPPTATPYPGEIRTPVLAPTVTPLPISKITDLVPDLPDEEKMVNIIRRADGAYEKFLTSVHYTGDVRTLLGLGPGDVLVNKYPLKPRPSTPPLTKPIRGTPTGAP